MERAASNVGECLSMQPEFWIPQFVSKQPFKSPADAKRLAATLRLAGLPR